MLQKPFVRWLIVLLALLGVGAVLRITFFWRDMPDMANVAGLATIVLASGWSYYGLARSWVFHWAKVGTVYLLLSNFIWGCAAIAVWRERPEVAIGLMGFWSLVVVGLVGIAVMRALCRPSTPVFGIARTVINQAQRSYITIGVIVVVVFLVLGMSGWLEENRINFRLSFYLAWSMRLSIFVLSVVTAVLAAFTITYDLTRKQLFMLASKPVGRFSYLAGKWLGMALLNLVFVAIVGVGVWVGAMIIYKTPLPDDADPEAVRSLKQAETEVLTSRVVALPQPPEENGWNQMLRAELERLHRDLPQIWPEKLEELSPALQGELRGKALASWHTIPPGGYRVYRFTGFSEFRQEWLRFMEKGNALKEEYDALLKQEKREEAAQVQAKIEQLVKQMPVTSLRLRIRPKYESTPSGDERVYMVIQVGDHAEPLQPMVNDTVRELPVPYQFIAEDGSITFALQNLNAQNPQATNRTNIKFVPNEGIQLVYASGSFGANIVAAMFMHWVRLCFIAMVGLACGTFLGFPMSVLTTLFIYTVASLSSYAGEALAYYTPLSVKGKGWWEIFTDVITGMWAALISLDFGGMFKLFIKLLGDIVLFLVPSFSEYNPTPLVADGRAVSLSLIGQTALYVGLVWTGAVAFIGWLIFRKKELARITV